MVLEDSFNSGNPVDIVCITEHNMVSDDVNLLQIPNFELAAYYARENRHGGTCILVRNQLRYKLLTSVANYSVCNIIECCGIDIIDHNLKIICFYRVPT